jgi:hypothetical protein
MATLLALKVLHHEDYTIIFQNNLYKTNFSVKGYIYIYIYISTSIQSCIQKLWINMLVKHAYVNRTVTLELSSLLLVLGSFLLQMTAVVLSENGLV